MGLLGKIMLKKIGGELKLEEWGKLVLDKTRRVFCIYVKVHLGEIGLDRET